MFRRKLRNAAAVSACRHSEPRGNVCLWPQASVAACPGWHRRELVQAWPGSGLTLPPIDARGRWPLRRQCPLVLRNALRNTQTPAHIVPLSRARPDSLPGHESNRAGLLIGLAIVVGNAALYVNSFREQKQPARAARNEPQNAYAVSATLDYNKEILSLLGSGKTPATLLSVETEISQRGLQEQFCQRFAGCLYTCGIAVD